MLSDLSGWNLFKKTSNLSFTIGSCMGNGAKSQFYLHTREKSAITADVGFGMWKTMVVRIHIPLSFIKICQFSKQNVCEIFVKPKALHKTSAPTCQFWNFFILNLFSFHFHFVAIILHLWLMKFSIPGKWTYLTR
jgi:hypothetical protein